MRKRGLGFGLVCAVAAGMLSFGCDDSSSSKGHKSLRDLAEAEAKAAGCSVSMLVGQCSPDGSSMMSVSCNGVMLANFDGGCPAGTKCQVIEEMIGAVPYCVLDDVECVVSTCDQSDSNKLIECNGGKKSTKTCASNEVCRAIGKDGGKDMSAACEKVPEPKQDDPDPDICELAGHGQIKSTACSHDNQIAMYTCSKNNIVLTENCGFSSCEAANLKTLFDEWLAKQSEMMKTMFGMLGAAIPNKEIHGCDLENSFKAFLAVLEMAGGGGFDFD